MRLLVWSLVLSFPVLLSAQPKYNPSQKEMNVSAPTLSEKLGFKANDKLLIINGDDVGMCHSANVATIDAMENGLMTSATIMVPCPWFPEIAGYARTHPDANFGVHLTHTSEWKGYKWGPVAETHKIPGLVTAEGFLWAGLRGVYAHATPEQAEIEARAQIEKALSWGIDITHLDSHMGTLQFDLEYYKVYRKLALEYNLPLRMAPQDLLEPRGGGHLREQLAYDGVVFTDHFIYGQRREGEITADYWRRVLKSLKPGVTELFIHAGVAGEELKAVTGSWKTRAEEYRLFSNDEEMKDIIAQEGIKLISYRPLRELQHLIRGKK